ncbi:ribbon-helix-helix domain-containing protein [Streptomyces sp. TS71-3]|uniref:ribbon-helix-helix domain-containing protein n=1 Tax=Streptomyces sp. TS71-3 TaxID=2733862 RepID=UPI001B070A82|nr:ribbon-helix-helix domain-containing protein [Streptomyces sp. TS71-3]GHJ37580.1 hypothetical protein Sm713_31890 [Streptomyces sp. TS71-3]
MKISVSLPEEDVSFVDEYGAKNDAGSRSAVIQAAIRMLRDVDLEDQYLAAWDEWQASGEEEFWGRSSGDGITEEDWSGK